MAKVDIKIKGLKALQEELNAKREAIVNGLRNELSQLAESAVTYSKDNKGYKDRTANLKNSISFALYLDGELVNLNEGKIPKPDKVEGGQKQVSDALDEYAKQDGVVTPKGFSLLIVAGMSYGKYVEDRGYNVLFLTKYFLQREMKAIFERVVERINNGEV